MPISTHPDDLMRAARQSRVTFDDLPTRPVSVESAWALDRDAAEGIIARYTRHGFAVVQLRSAPASAEALRALADGLGLGEPFVPPLYMSGEYRAAPISRISKPSGSATTHPSFERSVGLKFHCDGTLQPIGMVKTSILLCEAPSTNGGDTILFNAAGAYAQLVATDGDGALALSDPRVLVRQANMNGCTDSNVGPAFTVQDGELVCGYSVTETDSWSRPAGVNPADIDRAVTALKAAARPGSRFFARFPLLEGQAIILDNTRVSHGRTSYRDTPAKRRCLFRGLYLARPILLDSRKGVGRAVELAAEVR